MHVFIHQPGIVPVILLYFTNHHHDTELSGFGNGAVLTAHVRTIIINEISYISLMEENIYINIYIYIQNIFVLVFVALFTECGLRPVVDECDSWNICFSLS
jgi:hypothetical protein